MHSADKKQNYMRSGIAAFVGAMLLIGMLFSHIYIANEYHHDCTGEECPICQCIAECEAFIEQISTGVILFIAIAAVIFAVSKTVQSFKGDFLSNTLVSFKVRLNN
ncbi:hypothetical protein [Butyrivibrio hungatei]|uniref:Uncharacterized protein n=1 Tax=Butyrivibrio hungatei TaxID=185008 RepID=A0A1D9P562_9FIRM|nr:hypothetical protein [Butyrivibrio hungatei]AOZ97622.1 hypothetical protein bhn_I2590 [Butyrivibrio hungatei]